MKVGTLPLPPFGWVVEDTNADGYNSGTYAYNKWGTYSSSYAHTGLRSMRYEYASLAANDWFFTPAQSLIAGQTYTVSWWDRCYSTSYNEHVELWVGTAQNSVSMTTELWDDAAMKHTNI